MQVVNMDSLEEIVNRAETEYKNRTLTKSEVRKLAVGHARAIATFDLEEMCRICGIGRTNEALGERITRNILSFEKNPKLFVKMTMGMN